MGACAVGQRRRKRSELLGLHLEAVTLKTTSRSNCSALALIPRLGYLSVAAKCLTAVRFFTFYGQTEKWVPTILCGGWQTVFLPSRSSYPPFFSMLPSLPLIRPPCYGCDHEIHLI